MRYLPPHTKQPYHPILLRQTSPPNYREIGRCLMPFPPNRESLVQPFNASQTIASQAVHVKTSGLLERRFVCLRV